MEEDKLKELIKLKGEIDRIKIEIELWESKITSMDCLGYVAHRGNGHSLHFIDRLEKINSVLDDKFFNIFRDNCLLRLNGILLEKQRQFKAL